VPCASAGEGSFMICMQKSKTNKLGFSIWLEFSITQQSRDRKLIDLIKVYFNCGEVYLKRENKYSYYRIAKFEDILTKIIPFFQKYKLIGVKNKNFQDWCSTADLINKKEHLTKTGIDKITI
jgi:hypothetical protein